MIRSAGLARVVTRPVGAATFAALLVGPLSAQTTAVVTGRVSDASTRLPVPAAMVGVVGGSRVAVADTQGAFRLGALPAGPTSLFVRAIGYRPIQIDVVLRAGDAVRLADDALVLQPVPVVLPGIDVRADLAMRVALTRVGFYDRRARGFGVFAEQSEIGRWLPRALSDVFRHIPGMRVELNPNYGRSRPLPDFRRYLIELRGCRTVAFFLNGASIGNTGDPTFDIDLLLVPQDISAIEVYRGPSEIPPQYNITNGLCGVVLLWSE